MNITVEQIDATIKTAREFERENLGARNGEEFIEFAKALSSSKEFRDFVLRAYLHSLTALISGPPSVDDPSNPEALHKLALRSPMRTLVADALYIGYKLGLSEAEVKRLEELSKMTLGGGAI